MPGHEHLIGEIQLGSSDVALDHLVSKVAGDLDDRLAVDPIENPRRLRWGEELAVPEGEDVLARALAHETVRIEQDRLLVAGLRRLDLGQNAVEVLP